MLRVLTYHRVANPSDTPGLHPRLISATPAAFSQQMHHLATSYQVVPMAAVLRAVSEGTRLAKRAVLLTFDDAYRDFGQVVWPILKRYQLPATLFVPTAYPAQPERGFWWDRLYAAVSGTAQSDLHAPPLGTLPLGTDDERDASLRRLQAYITTRPHAEAMEHVDDICSQLGPPRVTPPSVLNWDELRQLADEGLTLGAHTQTHPLLTQLSEEQARLEIEGAKQDLQREIGHVAPVFCYPGGACNDAVVQLVKEAGYVLAFTTRDGHNRLDADDRLRLRRTAITRRTSQLIFGFRLWRLGSYLDQWRHRQRRRATSFM